MKNGKTKEKILRFIINVITSGKHTEVKSFETSDYLIRYVLMNFLILFGGIVLIFFIVADLRNGVYIDTAICASMTVVGIVCFFVTRTKVPQTITSYIRIKNGK